MYNGKSISVVVPCYNEETQIERVISTMPPYVDKIYIIDDCSKDQTSAVARKCGEQDPRVVVERLEKNVGVGGAIAFGYGRSLADGVDIAVVMAGDAQMDPADLSVVIEPIAADKADYCKGNRFLYAGGIKKIPRIRFWGNFVLSALTKIVSGYWHVSDTQCGYTAINRAALENIDFEKIYPRYGCPNDILTKLNIAEMRVTEAPINPVYGVGESSKMNIPVVILPILRLLARLFVQRLFEKYVVRTGHPLVIFYLVSLLLFALTGLIAFYNIVITISSGYIPMPSLFVAGVLFIVAIQLLLSAFKMDFEYNEPLAIKSERSKPFIQKQLLRASQQSI